MKTLIAIGMFVMVISSANHEGPKVYLESRSSGNTLGALRDASQEMVKDLARDCPDVRVTTSQNDADYRITLNHIELGLLVRNNQLAVADMFGNLISAKEKGSIKGGLKGICALITADWANQSNTRIRLVKAINEEFHRESVVGYAEVSGNKLTVHSERASDMRFHMLLADERVISTARRAGLVTYIYTNDADRAFTYNLTAGKVEISVAEDAAKTNYNGDGH